MAQSNLGSVLQGIFSTLEGDALQSAAVPLRNALTSIEKNPSPSNVIAQGALLTVALPLALPNLESTAVGQLATEGLKLLGQYVPPTS